MASFQEKHLAFAHDAQSACPDRLQCFLLPPSRLGVVSTSSRLETLSTARSHHCSRLLNRSSHLYAIYLLSNRSHDPPSNPGPFLVHVALRRHHPRSGNCRHRACGDGAAAFYFKMLKLWKADVLTALQMARYHINPRKFLLASPLCRPGPHVAVIMMAMDWPDSENAAWDCGVSLGCRYCVIIMLALVLLEILVAFHALPADNWEIPFPIDFRPERSANSPAREIMLFGPFRHPGSPWSPEPEIETQVKSCMLAAAEPPPTLTPATRRHRRTTSRNAGLEDDYSPQVQA
ncbi:uncharacterized protein IWZ02DRAFT_462986 [Phyllosticta citriasiana]|uniref:uncharacterized protein n=1 Tax=Phyllosticta citriasiana TaxID=595635 RepID=UPI0030FDD085